MKEIRLCWLQAIYVVENDKPVHASEWEADTPAARDRLEARSQAGNASDGPDTYWIEEREG